MNNPLLDKDFLLKLDKNHSKEIYARITSLSWDEAPLERLEGKIAPGGSISIDGNSGLRRTCSLTINATEEEINNINWALHTKFKLEVGIKNDIDKQYPDIIWFNQGIFVFTSYNTSISTNKYSVSINGKDKMCLLNGDIGGNINASVDYGTDEFVDVNNNTVTYTKVPIQTIIRNVVQIWGQEQAHNITINDLDPYGLELMEYRGDTTVYIIYDNKSDSDDEVVQITFEPSVQWVGKNYNKVTGEYDIDISGSGLDSEDLVYRQIGFGDEFTKYSKIQFDTEWREDGKIYSVGRCRNGDTAGYRLCDLVYAGDLTCGIGDTVCSVLDKVKNMLGNYEYFYDVDGRFVFQKKPAYIPTYKSMFIDSQYVRPTAYADYISYNFSNLSQITQISNTPNLTNLKNDFTIWGSRKGLSDTDIAIHYRYSLDKIPETYTTLPHSNSGVQKISKTYSTLPKETDAKAREAYIAEAKIKQSALDAIEKNTDMSDNEKAKARISICQSFEDNTAPLVPQITWGYIELLYQMAEDNFFLNQNDDYVRDLVLANPVTCSDGMTHYEEYYTDVYSFGRQIYDLEFAGSKNPSTGYEYNEEGYNVNILQSPQSMTFMLEFADEGTGYDDYLIPAIGDRTKVVNDTNIKSLYYEQTPNEVFYTDDDKGIAEVSGLTRIHLTDNVADLFIISARGISAYDKLEELLQSNLNCAERINITTVPIYYLQPNTRIVVVDKDTKIDGEYIIDKISISLTYNSTMSIQATKAYERII